MITTCHSPPPPPPPPQELTLDPRDVATSAPPPVLYVNCPRCALLPAVPAVTRAVELFRACVADRGGAVWFSYSYSYSYDGSGAGAGAPVLGEGEGSGEGRGEGEVPLKAHLPLGLLFDRLCDLPSSSAPRPLPLPVTVHFSGFPHGQLLRTCATAAPVPAVRAAAAAAAAEAAAGAGDPGASPCPPLPPALPVAPAASASHSALQSLFLHSLKQALYLLHGSTRAFNALTAELRDQLWMGE